jgi:hypothetical protein
MHGIVFENSNSNRRDATAPRAARRVAGTGASSEMEMEQTGADVRLSHMDVLN